MTLKRVFLHFGLVLNLVLVQTTGFAQSSENSENREYQALRIEGIDNTVLDPESPSSPQEEVTFTYDPKALEGAPALDVSLEQLKVLSQEMQTEKYQADLSTQIVIPISTDDPAQLEALQDLKPEQVQTFLSKKNHFLTGVANFFKTLHVRIPGINKLVALMNKQFFKSPKVVADANARVFTLQLGVSSGVGLSDWLMNQLRKSPYLADLPERAGFYFMFGAGFSIVRTYKDGKNRISIEPVLDFRRATRILSPFVVASVGVIAGYTWENRQEVTSLQKATFYKVSMLTALSGAQQFGISGSFAVSFPPGGGLAAGMEGDAYRLRLTRQALPQVMEIIKDSVFKSKAIKCTKVFE